MASIRASNGLLISKASDKLDCGLDEISLKHICLGNHIISSAIQEQISQDIGSIQLIHKSGIR